MSSIGKAPPGGNAASEAAVPDPLTPAAGTSPEQDRKPGGNANPMAFPPDPSQPSNGVPPGDDRKPTKLVEWITAVIAAFSAVVAFYTYDINSRLAVVQTELAVEQTESAEMQTGLSEVQTELTKVQTELTKVQTDLAKSQNQLTQAQNREIEYESRGEIIESIFATQLRKNCHDETYLSGGFPALYRGYVQNAVLKKVQEILEQCSEPMIGGEPMISDEPMNSNLDYLLVVMKITAAAKKFAQKVTVATTEVALVQNRKLPDYGDLDGKSVPLVHQLPNNDSIYIPIALVKNSVPGLAPVIVPKSVFWHSPLLDKMVRKDLDFPTNQDWVGAGTYEWQLLNYDKVEDPPTQSVPLYPVPEPPPGPGRI